MKFNHLLILLPTVFLSGCFNSKSDVQDGPPRHYQNISLIKEPTPHYLPKSPYGNPASYAVNGQTYHVLDTSVGYDQRGIASWYGSKFSGKLTSTREFYNPYKMTAASPVLPIPCFVRVTNLQNNRSIVVKVNDRGPFAPNRIIDLSFAAATKLGYARHGTALVEVKSIDFNKPNVRFAERSTKAPHLYLQVGAFSQWANASQLQREITSLTQKQARIQRGDDHHHAIYRVQLGPLRGVGESDRLQAMLKQKGYGKSITLIQ